MTTYQIAKIRSHEMYNIPCTGDITFETDDLEEFLREWEERTATARRSGSGYHEWRLDGERMDMDPWDWFADHPYVQQTEQRHVASLRRKHFARQRG